MKTISLMFAAAAATLLTGCSETWDDNPVLNVHEGEPIVQFLNEPVMGNTAILITEENKSESLHLTCSQPDYGYAAAAAYTVEISLSEDFITPVVSDAPASFTLPTMFGKCSEINPINSEIAQGLCKMLDIESESQVPTPYHTLYVRLRAAVYNESGDIVPNTTFISNTVKFEQVSCGYLAIIVPGLPTGIYLRGGMNGWGALPEYEFQTTTEQGVYELNDVSISAGTEFKVADGEWGVVNYGSNGEPLAFGAPYVMTYNAGNMSFAEDFSGRVQLTVKGGTYTVLFEADQPETPGQASGIYLRGDMNGWGTEAAYEFVTCSFKNKWEIAHVEIPAGTGFKVADSGWSSINLGGSSAIVPGVAYTLEAGGGNISIEENFSGAANLQIKGGKYVLTLTPQ